MYQESRPLQAWDKSLLQRNIITFVRIYVRTYVTLMSCLWQSRETNWLKMLFTVDNKFNLKFWTGVVPQIWKYLIFFSVDRITVWFFLIGDERNSTLLSSLKGPLTFQHPQFSISVSCDLLVINRLKNGYNWSWDTKFTALCWLHGPSVHTWTWSSWNQQKAFHRLQRFLKHKTS